MLKTANSESGTRTAFSSNFHYYIHPEKVFSEEGTYSVSKLRKEIFPICDQQMMKIMCGELKRLAGNKWEMGVKEAHRESPYCRWTVVFSIEHVFKEFSEEQKKTKEYKYLQAYDMAHVNLGEDPQELKGYKSACSFVEKQVLQNSQKFFEQDAGKIEAAVRMTHFYLADKTKVMEGNRGGKYRQTEKVVQPEKCDERIRRRAEMRTGAVEDGEVKWDEAELARLSVFGVSPGLSCEKIGGEMKHLAQAIKLLGEKIIKEGKDPIESAAWLHHEFGRIQPFFVGNGRVARLWMNTFLVVGGKEEVYFQSDEEYTEKVIEGEEVFASHLRELTEA